MSKYLSPRRHGSDQTSQIEKFPTWKLSPPPARRERDMAADRKLAMPVNLVGGGASNIVLSAVVDVTAGD
jgi:hypothetical protein